MKKCRFRVLLSCLVLSVCVVVFGTSRVGWGKVAASGAAGSEVSEIERLFAGIEQELTAIEKDVGENKNTARKHFRALDGMVRLLDFLSKEAAQTLGARQDLTERLGAIRKRIETLMEQLGGELDSESEEIQLGRRYSAKTKTGGRPAAAMKFSRVTMDAAAMPRAAGRAMPMITSPVPSPVQPPAFSQQEAFNREAYAHLDENPFVPVLDDPLSTFSVDVDTASYSNLRRLLNEGRKVVPKGAIRIEEMVNYFKYTYNQPGKEHPLAMDVETTACPWTPAHRLARVALQARTIDLADRKPSNLVFLIDTSGSMRSQNKIELLKEAYKLLIDNLDDSDKVAIVAYAGSAGLVLPSTTANNKLTLKFAVEKLAAGGTTAGGAGIKLAYKTAVENFIKDGNNRVILATDGDFNVGVSSESELVDLITDKAKSGVFLTVLGFGSGNYQDARMESLSNRGNGNYAYIDSMVEARKVFLSDLTGTLYTVAKDVKFQIEFNPVHVASYRLIGYENRQLADRDFTDDKKDAGEVGSGHQVTAIYELVPVGVGTNKTALGDLRYQTKRDTVEKAELMNIKVRYKTPAGQKSTEFCQPVLLPGNWTEGMAFAKASGDTRFASAVAAFGMIMRGSAHKGQADMDWVYKTAQQALELDSGGYRSGFCELVRKARELKTRPEKPAPVPPPREPVPVPM